MSVSLFLGPSIWISLMVHYLNTSPLLFSGVFATQFKVFSVIKDNPCFFPLLPHILLYFKSMFFMKNWLSFPFDWNCFMECNIIIIFSLKILMLLFQRAEKNQIFFFMFLTRCSFIVERLWKKILFPQFGSLLPSHTQCKTCHVLTSSVSIDCQLCHLCQSGLIKRQKAVICCLASIWLTWAMEQPVSSSSEYKLQMWRFGKGQVIYALKVQLQDSLNYLQFRADISTSFWMK